MNNSKSECFVFNARQKKVGLKRGGHSRVLTAVTLILVLVVDVVTVAARHHRQLGMCQHRFTGIQPPEGPVTITNIVYEPCSGMTHFMN